MGIDEAWHDDHSVPVDHMHPRWRREVHSYRHNLVAHNEHVGVLDLSEDALVSEGRIHREHKRGVPNQIAACEVRGRLARVGRLTYSPQLRRQ